MLIRVPHTALVAGVPASCLFEDFGEVSGDWLLIPLMLMSKYLGMNESMSANAVILTAMRNETTSTVTSAMIHLILLLRQCASAMLLRQLSAPLPTLIMQRHT